MLEMKIWVEFKEIFLRVRNGGWEGSNYLGNCRREILILIEVFGEEGVFEEAVFELIKLKIWLRE